MTKNLKKLTPTAIKKAEKKISERTEMVVTLDNEEYRLDYDKVFRKTKQQNVVNGIMDFFLKLSEEGVKEEYEEFASPYASLLMLKEFTSLDVPEDLDDQIAYLRALVDTGLLSEILSKLPEDQIIETFETINQAIESLTDRILEMENEQLEEEDVVDIEDEDEDFEAELDGEESDVEEVVEGKE